MSRWLSWQPPTSRESPQPEPSKHAEPGLDGFVGSIEGDFQSIAATVDSWEWIEERAAILEYDAGMDRGTANALAFEIWFRQFVGGTVGMNQHFSK